jgi:hypothetical protein
VNTFDNIRKCFLFSEIFKLGPPWALGLGPWGFLFEIFGCFKSSQVPTLHTNTK